MWPAPARGDGRAVTDGGRKGGQTEGGRADGQSVDGRAGGRDDFEREYNDVHRFSQKTLKKTMCFSVVSHPAEAQVPIFTAQMKKASKKRQTSIVFFLLFKSRESASTDFYTQKSHRIHRKRDTERGAQPPEHSRQRSG